MLRTIALLFLFLTACAAPRDLPRPAWSEQALDELRQAAATAQAEGLPVETVAINELELYRARLGADADAAQQLDLVADELFARLARSFARGALDPAVVDPAWHLPRNPDPDAEALRGEAWRRGVGRVLGELLPGNRDYAALRAELARVKGEAEGAVDPQGRSRETRIDRLRASMERWRWLSRDIPGERVETRIAQFEVVIFENGSIAETHRAIVGARNTQTPSFDAQINAVTLNPAWTVPRSILVNELIPRFRRDPAAASRSGYEVIDAAGRTYDPSEVDWSGHFSYMLRHRPGGGNPLGRLKFEMPNRFDVYLHDTSNPELFERSDRALSHGCIRLAEPQGVALRLLGSAWERSALEAAISAGATRSLPIAQAVPFYAIYMTATVSNDGAVSFADDIYGRDTTIIALLDAPETTLASIVHPPSNMAECR